MNKSIEQHQQHFETIFHHTIEDLKIPCEQIKKAMMYALFPGGKRVRPMLVYLTGTLLDIPTAVLDVIAEAIELIHGYSLIHDDLPAMDDDDFRRGKPSCHKAFNEATAILVGDGMQALAFELLLTKLSLLITPERVIRITTELTKAIGVQGMISGQSLDLSQLTNEHIQEEDIRHIHQLKTGRLITACINMVLSATEASASIAQALTEFGDVFGLTFQMIDDYLDRFDTSNSLGKGRSSDTANGKMTYVDVQTQSLLHLKIQNQLKSINQLLMPLGPNAHELYQYVVKQSCATTNFLTEETVLI